MKKLNLSYRCISIRTTDSNTIIGQIPYDSPSEDLGYTEILKRGCFSRAILKADNILSLWNHDPGMPIASTKSGTLTLNDTADGLNVRIAPNLTTTWGQNALSAVKRGDITGLSFGFNVKDNGIKWTKNHTVGEIHEVNQLFEVSPVAFPAYPSSCVRLRSSQCSAGRSLYLKSVLRDMQKFFGVQLRVLSREKQRELQDLRDYFERKKLIGFFRRANLRRYFQQR